MRRFLGILGAAVALARPAGAANTNLTATAHYSASSEWESNRGNAAFVAAKAFDGETSTRWNVAGGNDRGSWLAARWDGPVTINRVVVREAFDRLDGFRIQRLDAASGKWVDAKVVEGQVYLQAKRGDPNNPAFVLRFVRPIETTGLRVLFTQVRSSPSIFEVEAWDRPAGVLTGVVTDPQGRPIEGAVVRVGEDQDVTGADGRYRLLTDAGALTLRAGKEGSFRERAVRGVALPADGSATLDFGLQPLPPNLSLSATAVSSSDWEDGDAYDAAKANDGNRSTRWNSHASDASGAYLELQWPEPQTFNQITLREAFDRIRNYSLESYDPVSAVYRPFFNADLEPSGGDRTARHLLPAPVTTERLRLAVNVTDAVPSIYELEVARAPVAFVQGTVTDTATGGPLRRATIVDEQGVALGTANDRGEFHLQVEPGDHGLGAAAEGYFGATSAAFSIEAGETRQVALAAAPRGDDLAVSARATASSEADGGEHGATRVNDADPGTFWLARAYADQWVGLRWDRPVHFTAVQLRGFQGVIQRSYLEVLEPDGKSWRPLTHTSFAPQFLTGPADFFLPEGISTSGLRYFITSTHSVADIPGLAEIRVYDAPLPKP
jgi:protocatechuate 3,4-dioxygenase beta subunit